MAVCPGRARCACIEYAAQSGVQRVICRAIFRAVQPSDRLVVHRVAEALRILISLHGQRKKNGTHRMPFLGAA